MEAEMIEVLDKGYVRLVDSMGTDLTAVNAARVSFARASSFDENGDLKPADQKLLGFLQREGHTSPFRHAFVSYEIKAPLLVARQWWKYVVGSDHTMDGWNEVSRRYVADEPEFYVPEVWRSAPENKKQGSGVEVSKEHSKSFADRLQEDCLIATALYKSALNEGVCAEQARLFLPAYAMYTTWYWSASMASVSWFLHQRLADDAQWEIQQYAKAVYELTKPLFPVTLDALQ